MGISNNGKIGEICQFSAVLIGNALTFGDVRNPVGVITDGWTWLLHKPSHLLTITSALQVRCIRPNSSNSSFIKCISDLTVSQFSSPDPGEYRKASILPVNKKINQISHISNVRPQAMDTMKKQHWVSPFDGLEPTVSRLADKRTAELISKTGRPVTFNLNNKVVDEYVNTQLLQHMIARQ
uniref:Uncharacterized protein n=1 Tax=Glossina austeni TaxID=7395 RepID=A0A1A9ULS3_GLOAU